MTSFKASRRYDHTHTYPRRGGLGPRLYTHVHCSCNVNAGVSNSTQVQVATSSEELQALIQEEEFDFRFRCGYSKPVAQIDISDRD